MDAMRDLDLTRGAIGAGDVLRRPRTRLNGADESRRDVERQSQMFLLANLAQLRPLTKRPTMRSWPACLIR